MEVVFMPLSPYLKFLIPGLIFSLYGVYWLIFFPIDGWYITNQLSSMNSSGNPALAMEMQMLLFMSSAVFVDSMILISIACICIGLPLLIVGIKKRKNSERNSLK